MEIKVEVEKERNEEKEGERGEIYRERQIRREREI